MAVAIVTGSGGLIGAEAVRRFVSEGLEVIGVDNDLRAHFFGPAASTRWSVEALRRELPGYRHEEVDIRDEQAMSRLFAEVGGGLTCVLHAAAQPSHDWAASDPLMDFDVNARGTLVLLECTRRFAPQAAFLFTSTNKVYGDRPNSLPLNETETRLELAADHPWFDGIDESMSIDETMHSVFGASKVAADVMVQEYGRYFGLKTACFRGGCLTGSGHSGAELHGFLAYLVRCALTGTPYRIIGHGGKQVRDNIHAHDLVGMFLAFLQAPRIGAVYNAGGARARSCSILEAIARAQELAGRPMSFLHVPEPRKGDHAWWISSVDRFQIDYPAWEFTYSLDQIFEELAQGIGERLKGG